jgi:Fic family protein
MELSAILSDARTRNGFTFRMLGHETGIDVALLNKYEKAERVPSKKHLEELIRVLKLNEEQTKTVWLSEKVYALLHDQEFPIEALQVAEQKIQYFRSKKKESADSISKNLEILLAELNALHKEWSTQKPLNATQLRKMEEYFSLNYTYESNRIEGNTLTLQETHLIVNEGITVGGKSMREHLEAINHAEAIVFLSELVKEKVAFTERILKQIHYLILKGIDRENAGVYRSVAVRISGSSHTPPEPYLLSRMMEEVFEYYEANRKILHPVILAAEMHERIVRIHPFVDGNGRTTRLVMNLILMQNGYPIANIKGDTSNRLKYYSALENAPIDARNSFREFIAEAAIQSLKEHLELSK